MKRLITRYGLAMLVMLGASGIAHASYTCDQGGTPPPYGMSPYSGNLIIVESGPCTLSGAVYATGSINISAGGNVQTQAVNSSGSYVYITTTSGTVTASDTITSGSSGAGDLTISDTDSLAGTIQTQALTSGNLLNVTNSHGDINVTGDITSYEHMQVQAPDGNINIDGDVTTTYIGNILLVASENLAVNNITDAPGGNIDLKANGGSGNPFIIGSSGNTNGVNGTITASGNPALAGPLNASVAVYITNATGGIQLFDATAITASGSSNTGYIILNAGDDTLEVVSGTLSADGVGSYDAGEIQLLANTVTFDANATLSASQSDSATGSLHGVAISAQTVNFSSGLTIHADGSGYGTGSPEFVELLPEGATAIADTGTFEDLPINVINSPGSAGAITYAGGDLTVTTNPSTSGDSVGYSFINAQAFPMTFSGGAVTFQANGAYNNTIQVQDTQTGTTTGINFTGSGDVTLDASGPGYNSTGLVSVFTSGGLNVSGPSNFNLKANGIGYAEAGTVQAYWNSLSLGSAHMSATADGDNSMSGGGGEGNVKLIAVGSGGGTVTVGSGAGKVSVSAQANQDYAGTIEIGNIGTLMLDGGSVNLAVIGGGSGGNLNVHDIGTLTVTGTVAATAMAAAMTRER